jgi:uncharacterized membrane protein
MFVQAMVLMVLLERSTVSIIVTIIVIQRIYAEDQPDIIRILVMLKLMELLVRLIVEKKLLGMKLYTSTVIVQSVITNIVMVGIGAQQILAIPGEGLN